jgi:hypothetical protein
MQYVGLFNMFSYTSAHIENVFKYSSIVTQAQTST